MKISYIIGIVIIAVAIGVIVSTAGDASSYVTFKEAAEMAQDGDDSKIHVVGKLKKDAAGHIENMIYEPAMNPNYFEFSLLDQNNIERRVVYANPKPQDFDRTEQIVVIGCMRGETFVADKILMKCPSKYQENELKIEKKS